MQALTEVYSNAQIQQEIDEWIAEGEEADKAEPQITDPSTSLRASERRPKQQAERRVRRPPPAPQQIPPRPEPVEASGQPATATPKAVKNGAYGHGLSMTKTLEKVCPNPKLTSKAKLLALVLASHWPDVRPSRARLRTLTGLSLNGIARGLDELKGERLLHWRSGSAHRANRYTCLWLEP